MLAVAVPNVEFIFGLVGSTASVFIAYILPAMLFLSLSGRPALLHQLNPADVATGDRPHRVPCQFCAHPPPAPPPRALQERVHPRRPGTRTCQWCGCCCGGSGEHLMVIMVTGQDFGEYLT